MPTILTRKIRWGKKKHSSSEKPSSSKPSSSGKRRSSIFRKKASAVVVIPEIQPSKTWDLDEDEYAETTYNYETKQQAVFEIFQNDTAFMKLQLAQPKKEEQVQEKVVTPPKAEQMKEKVTAPPKEKTVVPIKKLLTFTEEQVQQNELQHMRQLMKKDVEITKHKQANDEIRKTHDSAMTELRSKYKAVLDACQEELDDVTCQLKETKQELITVSSVLMKTQYDLFELESKKDSSWLLAWA